MDFLTKLCLTGAAVLFAAWLVMKLRDESGKCRVRTIPPRSTPRVQLTAHTAVFLFFIAVAAIHGGAKNGTNALNQLYHGNIQQRLYAA